MKKSSALLLAVVFAILVMPVGVHASPTVRAIHSGIDLWSTPADGRTFTDFKRGPIPAGFFCAGSAPFAGRITYKGMPLSSEGADLRRADTIVQRLDDAPFNKRGVASTRIQVRALNLVSIEPVKTSCGAFDAKLVLAGDQPVTTMRIVRESATGGFYVANLALNAKLLFTPAGDPGAAPRVLPQSVRFNRNPPEVWTSERPGGEEAATAGFVRVDTDGDGRAETMLPGRSNFLAGVRDSQAKVSESSNPCHWYYDPLDGLNKQHCPIPDY